MQGMEAREVRGAIDCADEEHIAANRHVRIHPTAATVIFALYMRAHALAQRVRAAVRGGHFSKLLHSFLTPIFAETVEETCYLLGRTQKTACL